MHMRVPPNDHRITVPGWRFRGDTRDVLLTVERPENDRTWLYSVDVNRLTPPGPPPAPPGTVLAPTLDPMPWERSEPQPWRLDGAPVLLRVAAEGYDDWLAENGARMAHTALTYLITEDRHTGVEWRLECTGYEPGTGPAFRGDPVTPYEMTVPSPWGNTRHDETAAYLHACKETR